MKNQFKHVQVQGIHEVGQFVVEGGEVEVTDPCYEPGAGVIVKNVKDGNYLAFTDITDTGGWGLRNSMLCVINKEYIEKQVLNQEDVFNLEWIYHPECFGVDSGQAGVFSCAQYKGGNDEEFYNRCCDITLKGINAGSVDFGALSSSGYGDGQYAFYILMDEIESEVVGIQLVFIDDEDDEEEENEEVGEE